MDLVSRLKYYIEFRELSVSQFADTCGIPRPTMSQILNGRNKKISDELISKIHLAYPSLSVLWLMFGEGCMTINENIEISGHQNNDSSLKTQPQQTIHQPNSSAHIVGHQDIANSGEIENKGDVNDCSHKFDCNTPYKQPENTENDKTSGLIDFWVDDESISNSADCTNSTSNLEAKQNNVDNSKNDIITDSDNIIPLPTKKGKQITNIVVFYSDNSFQSFTPS